MIRRALAVQAVLAFASFEPEPGLKFTNIYEVYSQRFQREDFDENQKFDPKVLPSSYLTDPQLGQAFVYVSTIQRMTINLLAEMPSSPLAMKNSMKMRLSWTFRFTPSTSLLPMSVIAGTRRRRQQSGAKLSITSMR